MDGRRGKCRRGNRCYNETWCDRRDATIPAVRFDAERLMSDEIRIKGLFLRTIIGINDDEREHKQDVRISLSLSVDTRPAGRSDKIEDAVNYRTIAKDVIDLVENSKFFLVERMAEQIARECSRDRAWSGSKSASKSRPPCGLPAPSASRSSGAGPMSEARGNRAYLSLGSNIDPEHYMPAAVRELARLGHVTAVSRVWESAPFGVGVEAGAKRAANFLNGAVLLETELSAEALCQDAVLRIETRLGRVRDPQDKNAPRTIDIDLSLFNRERLTIGHRTIPDPDIASCAFVAVPLAELDGAYVLPNNGRTLAEIAAELLPAAGLKFAPTLSCDNCGCLGFAHGPPGSGRWQSIRGGQLVAGIVAIRSSASFSSTSWVVLKSTCWRGALLESRR